jgi:hypothetical protein
MSKTNVEDAWLHLPSWRSNLPSQVLALTLNNKNNKEVTENLISTTTRYLSQHIDLIYLFYVVRVNGREIYLGISQYSE